MTQFSYHADVTRDPPPPPPLPIPRSPLQTFLLIFTTAILQCIVDQSNLYASQCMGERFDTWQPVTMHRRTESVHGFHDSDGCCEAVPPPSPPPHLHSSSVSLCHSGLSCMWRSLPPLSPQYKHLNSCTGYLIDCLLLQGSRR